MAYRGTQTGDSSVRLSSRIRVLSTVCLVSLTLILAVPAIAAEDPPPFLFKWGSYGATDGKFDGPRDVAVDASGNVYVADRDNNRIQKFTDNGNYVTHWGTPGSGESQFNYPTGVAVDANGDVYVADYLNHRVQKFQPNGTFITEFGEPGTGNGQFDGAADVAVSSSGTVYVTDYNNSRVQAFAYNADDCEYQYSFEWGTYGGGIYDDEWGADGTFCSPCAIAVDTSGCVYVADSGQDYNRVQKFDAAGNFITKWGGYGGADGQFNHPMGIAVHSSGIVYVADQEGDRIQAFDSAGVFITKWGTTGTADGKFNDPCGVAVSGNGNVYVADFTNNRIQVFGYTSTAVIDIPLLAGWNMVSVPVEPTIDLPSIVFADAEAVLVWDANEGGYDTPASIEPGLAYWVAMESEDLDFTVTGTPLASPEDYEVAISEGWNMIGPVFHDSSAPIDGIVVVGDPDPDPLWRDAIYWWDAGNTEFVLLGETDDLQPGVGYWMACTADCTVTMAPPGV